MVRLVLALLRFLTRLAAFLDVLALLTVLAIDPPPGEQKMAGRVGF